MEIEQLLRSIVAGIIALRSMSSGRNSNNNEQEENNESKSNEQKNYITDAFSSLDDNK